MMVRPSPELKFAAKFTTKIVNTFRENMKIYDSIHELSRNCISYNRDGRRLILSDENFMMTNLYNINTITGIFKIVHNSVIYNICNCYNMLHKYILKY